MLEETLSYLAESLEDLLVPEAPQDAKGKTLHKVCTFVCHSRRPPTQTFVYGTPYKEYTRAYTRTHTHMLQVLNCKGMNHSIKLRVEDMAKVRV